MVFGLLSLAAHLHHSLGNITQTFGVSATQNHIVVFSVLILLIGGFASVPLSIIF